MERRDLSELDRNTLRLWRATNLIGWGAAGLGAFVVTYVLLQALVRVVGAAPTGGLQLLALPLAAVALLVPPLVAGIVIGDHVYRWPGWTRSRPRRSPRRRSRSSTGCTSHCRRR